MTVISSPTALTLPTLRELSNELKSVENWHLLGVKLGMEDYELHTIESNYNGNERRKHEMLGKCLRGAKLLTWKVVADALHEMGEVAVAMNIQAKHCSSFTDTGMCVMFEHKVEE